MSTKSLLQNTSYVSLAEKLKTSIFELFPFTWIIEQSATSIGDMPKLAEFDHVPVAIFNCRIFLNVRNDGFLVAKKV